MEMRIPSHFMSILRVGKKSILFRKRIGETGLYESHKAGRQAGEGESRDIKRKKKLEELRNPSLIEANGKNPVELNHPGS